MDDPFDLPYDTVVPVTGVELTLLPGPHPYETLHAADIPANWRREKAEKPAIFDGRIAMFSRLAIDDGAFRGTCHIGNYSSFLHWRRNRQDRTVGHAYANALLVTRDGALLGIEMGAHTVNADKVSVAAGSFEPEDFRDGRADIHFNMRREILEETGLDLDSMRAFPGWHVLPRRDGTAIIQRFALPMTADEAVARVAAFLEGETEPEITRAIVIRDDEWTNFELGPQMATMLAWHFAHPPAF